MANEAGEYVSQLQPTQQRRHSGIYKAELIKGYGYYQYYIPAQDQIIAYIKGMKICGTFKKRGDSQSDYTYAPLIQLRSEKVQTLIYDLVEKHSYLEFEPEESFTVDEPIQYVTVMEQADEQETDTTTDDISQWPSDQLASAIMDTKAKCDMLRLREMILIAEDTGFTVAQSEQLAPWLLSFAERYRDSSDPQDEAAVWSAIRTGASMLTPDDTDGLRPLLEPGHSIETSLVTVKMLGRIFEAQPPAEVDEHQELAHEVCQIAKSLLNRYVITVSQSAAMAQLAIYTLAAMASSKTQQIVETVKQLGVTWFTQQTLHEFRELRSIWSSRPVPVADRPQKLLDRVIQTLE